MNYFTCSYLLGSESNKAKNKDVSSVYYQRLFCLLCIQHCAGALAVCTKLSCSCEGISWNKSLNEETELWRRVYSISLKTLSLSSRDRQQNTRSCHFQRTGVSCLKHGGYFTVPLGPTLIQYATCPHSSWDSNEYIDKQKLFIKTAPTVWSV